MAKSQQEYWNNATLATDMTLTKILIDVKRLGEAIRQKRGSDTLAVSSEQTGVNITSLSRIERGFTTPDVNTYVKLCRWLGVSLDSFVIEDEDEPDPEASLAQAV